MSDFKGYWKNYEDENYVLGSEEYCAQQAWKHQQAKIEKLENELSTTKQVLGNVIDMEVAKVDNLKTQLNNMEACYIGKKKQVEDALSRVESLMVHAAADYENTKSTSMMCAVQELGKALRGAND